MPITYQVVFDRNTKKGWKFRGGNYDSLYCQSPQYMLSGPSETGKTIASCAKLHIICMKYPGSQHAMVRKNFNSITGTVGKTFERITKNAGVQSIGGAFPTRYVYPNGSTIWVGGLDNPDKILSAERDTIYVNQAEELSEADWEVLSTRCTGRGAVVKYPQLYGDCNPGGSKHWIRRKAAAGVMKLFTTSHKDNPTLFHEDGSITVQGERSLGVLGNLTGVRRKRLMEGIWATSEGAVYDMFDASVHVMVRDRKEFRRFFLAIDEGYTNPAVILLIGEDGDKRWHCFREFYKTGQLQEVVVQTALKWYKEFDCHLAAVDEAAAGLIADLVNSNMLARGGKGRVLDGIQKVQNRLALAGDQRPRYTIDPECVNHINEFESYVWKPEKDVPEKEFDHSLDAVRYLADVLGEPTGAWPSAAVKSIPVNKPTGDGLEFPDLELDVASL